jgi:hypothetical protein
MQDAGEREAFVMREINLRIELEGKALQQYPSLITYYIAIQCQ